MADRSAYWKRTRGLTLVVVALCVVLPFGVHVLAPLLDQVVVPGLPLGFYMTAPGLPAIFVFLLFWCAHRQASIDEKHGVD